MAKGKNGWKLCLRKHEKGKKKNFGMFGGEEHFVVTVDVLVSL